RVSAGGAPREEDCIAPWGTALLTKADLEPLRKLAESFGPAARETGELSQYPGFPIQRRALEGPGKGHLETLKSVKRGAIAKDQFAVPAGYTKKTPEEMHGAKGRPTPGTPPGPGR